MSYAGVAPVPCTLVKVELPGATVCLTDGGFVVFGGDTYLGEDPDYGSLDSVSQMKDGAGGDLPRVDITILPASDVAAAAWGSPLAQGARVRWWEGEIDPATGLLIGDPFEKFDGEIDKPGFNVGASWAMTLQCGTQGERQLEPNADWRLNHAHQAAIWAGDLGLSNVTNITVKVYWRQAPPNGAINGG